MSSDKRSVSTDALETLGTIIDASQKRDAIHLAVIPVVAAVKLFPGQDVGLTDAGAGPSSDPRGIVDPFLKSPVLPGERFWLVIYPRQITSLRHVWSHPAFPEESPSFHAEPDDHYVAAEAASRQWLDNYAKQVGISCKQLMDGAAAFVEDGTYLCLGGTLEGEWVPDEFWTHYERVTKTVVENRDSFFSCSC